MLLRTLVNKHLNFTIITGVLLRWIASGTPDDAGALGTWNSETIRFHSEAAHFRYLFGVLQEVSVLAEGTVLSLIFASVELIRTAGQQEEATRVCTACGYDRNPG
uniref:Putative secreted protein n=1 Tax=Anopheles darlingi TaxID=43151 RepID=A0A2M4D3R5_ANODA